MPRETILITGVTAGLGKALLEFYSAAGHKVYGCGRRAKELEALASEYPTASLRVLDVMDDEAVKGWAAETEGIGVVICNAGVSPESFQNSAPWEVSTHDFDNTLDVNIKGVMNVIRHFTPLLIKRGCGTIVGITSGLGRSPHPTHAAYCASKWAVEGLMKSVAMALPVPLTAVPMAPGVIRTDMQIGEGDGDVNDWVKVAGPLILSFTRADNGVSKSVPGFYTDRYMATWIIPNNAGVPEELGHQLGGQKRQSEYESGTHANGKRRVVLDQGTSS